MLSSDFMKILKGEDYSFLRENEHLAKKPCCWVCPGAMDAHIIDISAEEWAQVLEERRHSHAASVERLRMLYKQSN